LIRLLSDTDRIATVNLLQREPEMNMFALGQIERRGIDADTYLGCIRERMLTGVLASYGGLRWTAYALLDTDGAELAMAAEQRGMKTRLLSGKGPVVDSVLAALSDDYLAVEDDERNIVYRLAKLRPVVPAAVPVRPSEERDRNALVELKLAYMQERFGGGATLEQAKREIDAVDPPVIRYVAEENGTLLSTAEAVLSTKTAAIVRGMYTVPDRRGEGLGTVCLAAVCADVFEQREAVVAIARGNDKRGRRACEKLGFAQVGGQRNIRFAPQ